MSVLGSANWVASIVLVVLLVLLLVGRFAPDKRKHSRRILIMLGLFLLAWASARLVPHTAESWIKPVSRAAAEVLGFFTLVGVGGVVVFELIFPAIRIRLPTIVAELVMGACYAVAVLVVMKRFGLHPASILTTSAIVTGILALSLQATLGNVIGGVALQVDKSIRVGDWIQLENGRQGLVREIRWRHTVIETRDWDTMIVPNAQLLSSTITILGKRAGHPTKHRMWIYFNVDFRYSPAEVIQVVNRALGTAPIDGVASDPAPHCVCFDFARQGGDSMAYYAVRYWLTDLAADEDTNSAVRVRIFTALKRAQIPLAVPAAHLWIEQDSTERRARKVERDLKRRRDAIKTVTFLSPLNDDEIATLADNLRFSPYAAGETIMKEGAVAHWLYILTEGEAEVIIDAGGGKQHVAHITGPDVFGEMGLMTGAPRAASVVARTDVQCYRLDKEAFHDVLARRPELANEISTLMAARQLELASLREGSDAVPSTRMDAEKRRLLTAVQRFFGLDGHE
jgi:small-conductance mechanosensitive channel